MYVQARQRAADAAQPEGYHVVSITTADQFRALKADWDRLISESRGATPFQTFEWQWSWWSAFGRGRRLLIVTVRNGNGELSALAPFMITRRYGVRVLELLGTGLSDYLDVITSTTGDGVLDLCVDGLLRHRSSWDVACFQTPDSALAGTARLQQLAPSRELDVVSRAYEVAPFLSVGGTWSTFVSAKSKKFRYSLRERVNRFEAAEGATFRRLRGSDVHGALVEPMSEVERHSWKARAGTSGLQSRHRREFLANVLTAFAARGWVEVWLAHIADRPVAYVLTFVFSGRVYLYAISFDGEFSKLAPGMLLLQQSIQASFDEGAQEYDFLCGDEPYKDRWTEERRIVSQTLLVPRALRARLGGLLIYRVRWALAGSERLRAIRLRVIAWRARLTRRERSDS